MKLIKEDVVLFLPAWYPNRNDKMAGMFAQNHAIALREKLSVHVLYISPQKKLDKIFEFTSSANNEFIVYYRKPDHKNAVTIAYEGFLYGLAACLGYINYRIRFKKPKLFHVHVLTRAALVPFILSFFSNTYYYITEHWSRYLPQNDDYHGNFRKWLTKKIVKRSRGISTVSLAMKNALISHKLTKSNFPIISNVVDHSFFNLEPTKLTFPFRFIHVSCFDEKSKNITGMLKAFKMLEDNDIPYHLRLIGKGVDFLLINNTVAALELKNVTFTGELTGAELLNEYRLANVMVLFSNYENQPCVILEAQACGLPVIATNVGGIPELITPDLGVLIEANDHGQLSVELNKFIEGKYKFQRQTIKNNAKSKYLHNIVAQQFLNFYQAVK